MSDCLMDSSSVQISGSQFEVDPHFSMPPSVFELWEDFSSPGLVAEDYMTLLDGYGEEKVEFQNDEMRFDLLMSI